MEEPQRGIRAVHTESTITVYQAYSREIGLPAVREGRFPAIWKRDRMTWIIKPRSQTPGAWVASGVFQPGRLVSTGIVPAPYAE